MSLARYVLLHFFFLLSHLVPHSAHPPCLGFSCGNLGDIGFPLSNTTNPECGLSVMNCTGPQPKVQFHEQGKWYPVNSINYNGRSITIYDQDVQTQLESGRCDSLRNFTVQTSPLLSINVTDTSPLFKCKRENSPISPFNFFDKFSNYTGCRDYDLYFYPDTERVLPPLPETLYNICSVVHLPRTRIPVSASGLRIDNLTLLWNANFSISWDTSPVCIDCHVKGGLCLSSSNGTFLCGNLPKHERRVRAKIVLGVVLPAAGIIVVTLILVYLRTKAKNSILPWKKKTATTKHIEAFFKNRGSLSPKQYQYKEVRIMTCSFKKKLGQGGYGSVFKGMLKDGRLVAVKVLCETKGNGEEFINEVESISRTSHVNIVSLLGYCFEGSKRALLYEFMPNGSLEKFIFDEKKPEVNSHLGWETLYQIAVGIARGLEYLHRGCHTRILHFDIKPHNILLDQDFTPKISDFGMAKLCPRKESIVSMLGTRGTAGYIAPEVFSRNFGGVSHKSDVYSYGMMILEITGGTKNVDVEVGHSSDIYFPNWLYKCVEFDKDLPIHGGVSEVEKKIRKKMVLVGLWCIQTHPSDRPSMSRALEMLEGSLEVLPIPPKPCFSSPERVSFSSSITLPSSIMDNKV